MSARSLRSFRFRSFQERLIRDKHDPGRSALTGLRLTGAALLITMPPFCRERL